MKYLFLIATVFSFALGGWSQGNGWSISGNFQYDRSFQTSMDNNPFSGFGNYEPSIWSPYIFTYTAGASANYKLNNELEFFGGINFSRKKGYNYSPYYMCCFCDPTAMIDLPYYSYGYAQNFLEVPIGARIYALPGKFKLHFELAEVTSIPLVFNKNQFQEESIMFAGRFGTGIDYFLGRWQWSLTANYGRMFRPISRDSQDLWDQNNLGFEFRTAFHLGKD